jgi:hypothetical protein
VYPFFLPFYFKAQLISPFLFLFYFIYFCGGNGSHIESACLREKGQKFHPKKIKNKNKNKNKTKKNSPKKTKKAKSRKRQVPDHEEICGYGAVHGTESVVGHLADGSTESPEVGSFLVTEKETRQRQISSSSSLSEISSLTTLIIHKERVLPDNLGPLSFSSSSKVQPSVSTFIIHKGRVLA